MSSENKKSGISKVSRIKDESEEPKVVLNILIFSIVLSLFGFNSNFII